MFTRDDLRRHFLTVNDREPTPEELDELERHAASRVRDDYAQTIDFAPLGERVRQAAIETSQPGAQPPMGFSDIPGQRSYTKAPAFGDRAWRLAQGPVEVLNPPAMTAVPPEVTQQLANRGYAGMQQRANALIGTPYAWGGTTKQGIDCSAFISNVWGVPRQTTDTLSKVAKPVDRDELEPGDALNLPTWKDPRGYGHVRMFDGWADPNKKSMYVYESSSATGGVVRRVIPYDPSYQPMRLATSDSAEQRAEPIAQVTAAAGATTPSRPPDARGQRFLEANAPGESTTVAPLPHDERLDVTSQPRREWPNTTPEPPGAVPSMTTTKETPETPEQKRLREFLAGMQGLDAFSRHLAQQIEGVDTQMPRYALPGMPKIDLGWRSSRYVLPGLG